MTTPLVRLAVLGLGDALGRLATLGRGDALGRLTTLGRGEALGRLARLGRGEALGRLAPLERTRGDPLAWIGVFLTDDGVAERSLFTGVADLPLGRGT